MLAIQLTGSGLSRHTAHQGSVPQTPRRSRKSRLCTPKASRSADDFETFLLQTQQHLLEETEEWDGSQKFLIDRWERDAQDANAGYGITAVLEGGQLLEKAAVNISVVGGTLSAERAQAMSSRGRDVDPKGGQPYSAAALSLVYHPSNPHVPTLRADVRRFKVGDCTWYGGGCDLTPVYLYEEDARQFHAHWKRVCKGHGSGTYSRFKKWCDDYFFLPSRKEGRGIGGIFFDDLVEDPHGDFPSAAQFVREVADSLLDSWGPIVQRRRHMEFSQQQKEWQMLRRGRYLEFNLLYDRGVRFGINGRIESVMVSAPPLVAWKYNVVPEEGSPEARLVEVLQKPQEWA